MPHSPADRVASTRSNCRVGSVHILSTTPQAVVNGELDTTHPAVVALLSSQHRCTGTIIAVDGSTLFVLTAAHCDCTPHPSYPGRARGTARCQVTNSG